MEGAVVGWLGGWLSDQLSGVLVLVLVLVLDVFSGVLALGGLDVYEGLFWAR